MMASSTQDLHRARVTEACIWLARFGYLRSTEIALLMYPTAASSERLARRLMKSLSDTQLVIERRESVCEPVHYALSEAGARVVREATGAPCSSGKDLIREVSRHRDASNIVCAQAIAAGLDVLTDREIATSANPGLVGKVSDGLIIDTWRDDGGDLVTDYHWLEVENSKRGGRDLLKLAGWFFRVAFPDRSGLKSEYRDGYLASVTFIISNPAARTIRERLIAQLDALAITGEERRWLDEHAPGFIRTIDLTASEAFTPP